MVIKTQRQKSVKAPQDRAAISCSRKEVKVRALCPRPLGGDQDSEAHDVATPSFKTRSRGVCEPAACAELAVPRQE